MTTWMPKSKQIETWNAEAPPVRVFDPAVFDNDPIFDTGSIAGIWNEKSRQAEVWTSI